MCIQRRLPVAQPPRQCRPRLGQPRPGQPRLRQPFSPALLLSQAGRLPSHKALPLHRLDLRTLHTPFRQLCLLRLQGTSRLSIRQPVAFPRQPTPVWCRRQRRLTRPRNGRGRPTGQGAKVRSRRRLLSSRTSVALGTRQGVRSTKVTVTRPYRLVLLLGLQWAQPSLLLSLVSF